MSTPIAVLPVNSEVQRGENLPLMMKFMEEQPGQSEPSMYSDDSTYMGNTSTGGKDDGPDYQSD